MSCYDNSIHNEFVSAQRPQRVYIVNSPILAKVFSAEGDNTISIYFNND
jgi:hypothetical protein